MDDSRSTEPRTALLPPLGPHRRLVAIGGAIVLASLALPWYGTPLGGELVKTGFSSFGFAEAAMMLSLGAAAVLMVRSAGGYNLPKPLEEGALLAAAGVWVALLVCYRMLDRPEFELLGIDRVSLRYGIFIALGGAVTMVVGGLRLRAFSRESRGSRR